MGRWEAGDWAPREPLQRARELWPIGLLFSIHGPWQPH